MKNNKIWLGILIGVLVSIIVGLTGFMIYDKVLTKPNDKTNGEQNNNITGDEQCIDNSTTAEKLMIDTKRDISEGYTYMLHAEGSGFEVYLDNSKQISINIDWWSLKEKYSLPVTKENMETIKVADFSQEISDIFVGAIGNDISSTIIVLLMKDGTLEYIEIMKYINDSTTTIEHKKVDSVEDIIKFYDAGESFELNNGIGGGMTILAQKSDGSYYNLSQFIK